MSAHPITTRPPIRFPDGVVLAAPGTNDVIERALKNQMHGELREAVMEGWYVHYSDGTPSVLARDAIMAAAVGRSVAEDYLAHAMQAALSHTCDVGMKAEFFFLAAINYCAQDLVDRQIEGQRVSFGPLQ